VQVAKSIFFLIKNQRVNDFDALSNMIDESQNLLLYIEDIMNSIPEVSTVFS